MRSLRTCMPSASRRAKCRAYCERVRGRLPLAASRARGGARGHTQEEVQRKAREKSKARQKGGALRVGRKVKAAVTIVPNSVLAFRIGPGSRPLADIEQPNCTRLDSVWYWRKPRVAYAAWYPRKGAFSPNTCFFTNLPGSPHTSSYMSGHHPATVRRAGRKRGARFESCDEQHNIKK